MIAKTVINGIRVGDVISINGLSPRSLGIVRRIELELLPVPGDRGKAVLRPYTNIRYIERRNRKWVENVVMAEICSPYNVLPFNHMLVERLNGLPVAPTVNRRTKERGQAVEMRTWNRGGWRRRYVVIRIDTGSGYVFKTWLATNCEILVNNRVMADR